MISVLKFISREKKFEMTINLPTTATKQLYCWPETNQIFRNYTHQKQCSSNNHVQQKIQQKDGK